MTIYQFVNEYNKKVGDYYFSADTLAFFGERLSDMRILKKHAIKTDFYEIEHECFVLSKVSKDFTGRMYRNYDYFDINTYERID